MNDTFKQVVKQNGWGSTNGGPTPATFIRLTRAPAAPTEAPAASPPPAPGTLLDANGQEYVE